MAQSVEQLIRNQQVASSSMATSSTQKACQSVRFLLCKSVTCQARFFRLYRAKDCLLNFKATKKLSKCFAQSFAWLRAQHAL